MTIRIGYMGVPFSNTWEKTREFVEELGWKDVELVDLMSAKETVEAMEAGEVDYGVLAYTNSIAGTVKETANAIKGRAFIVIAKGGLQIHHCMFAKSQDTKIDCVSSHIHAISQCTKNLDRLYPGITRMESRDTAYSAQLLAEGKLPDTAAVLCRRAAGEFWGLTMIHENIEDRADNVTQFALIRLPKPSPDLPVME